MPAMSAGDGTEGKPKEASSAKNQLCKELGTEETGEKLLQTNIAYCLSNLAILL
jgi:hypothetical protein